MPDRIYYLVDQESPVMNVIREASEIHAVFVKAMQEFKREFKALDVWTRGGNVIRGLTFRGELPPGWRKVAGKEYAAPNARTKIGRALSVNLKALPRDVDAWQFSRSMERALGGRYEYNGGYTIRWTFFEQHGNTFILSVPVECKVTPPGCTELKMSEYWTIRESSGKEYGDCVLEIRE